MIYHNFAQWFEAAKSNSLPLARVVLENEMELTGKSEEEIYGQLAARWLVMKNSANKALYKPLEADCSLIKGQAKAQNDYAQQGGYCGKDLNEMMAMALSCSEANAAMGLICAAPTAGSCGILPAVLLYIQQHCKATEAQIIDALLVASGAGAIIMQNATVSGAEGGCQAECGAAAAMAGAAAVVLKGGDCQMVGNAVSIALVNCMGLICDPIAGLVQLPCSFRNASQAMNALLSADMALAGQQAMIPPDEVVEAMFSVGKKLPSELRETAQGGIAVTPTAKAIAAELEGAL